MENADRVDLATWVRTYGPMPADAAVAMVRQLAEALEATPEEQGDVTTADVVLDGVDGPRIDVSAMRASLSRDRATDLASSPGSGVEALGQVLQDALTGQAVPPSEPQVPARLREVVATATSPDPSVRYPRVGDLAAAAEAAMEAGTEQPEIPSTPTGGPADTLVRPVRPGPPTADPGTTLDRPIEPTADSTLDRPIEPAANSTLGRPIQPTANSQETLNRPVEAPPGAAAGGAPTRTEGESAPSWTSISGSTPPPPRRSGRIAVLVAALVAGLILAGVVGWFVLRSSDLQVLDATVVPATGSSASCDATVDLTGTIRTNGQAGTITYSWLRSDGIETERRSEILEEGATSVDVHLLWQITGRGYLPAAATLRVIEPTPREARADFVYDCR